MKKILLYLFILLFFGCQSSNNKSTSTLGLLSDARMENITEEKTTESEENIDEAPLPELKRPDKIIKEADIKFEVDNYKTAKKEIDSLVNQWGGYISKEDEQYSSYQIYNTIIIRVLNNKFESLLNDIGETSKRIDYKSVNTIDVTEEYIDIASRLKTKREVENRYYDILKKATKVEDILKVESEIGKIREEIEAKEGRLKYLDDRVSYSTITLAVYQKLEYKYKPQKESGFFMRFYKGLDKGWKGLLTFIIALVHIWPVILLSTVGLIIYSRLKKKKKTVKTRKE